jgi:hypothetical protein
MVIQQVGSLKDSPEAIVSALSRAINDGFGSVIRTGGVGAESKGVMRPFWN